MRYPVILTIFFCTTLCLLTSGKSTYAQQSCNEVEAVLLQCPEEEKISGQPPICLCDGARVDRLELTCEINFGCMTDQEVGYGDWPECACRHKEDVGGASEDGDSGGFTEETDTGGGDRVGDGLGGVATCEQFLDCPSGAKMRLERGKCICTIIALPSFTE